MTDQVRSALPVRSSDLAFSSLAEMRAVQDAALRKQLALCASGSAFYKRLWAAHGVDPLQITGVDDLEKLPLTQKRDFIADPEAFRLHCPDLPLHERALWEVNYTTGTSGNPSPIYMTTHDYLANMFQARRVSQIAGIHDTDVIANLLPMTPAPMGAFSRSVAYAYAAGATIGAGLTGARFSDLQPESSLDDAVRLVERHRATVLWGVTSFVRRAIIRATELGADFSSVRLCGITGEASSVALREDIRRRLTGLGATATIFDRYGTTESGGLAQCVEESDWHNPAPEILYMEVVDPETGRRLPDGERGVLALTHLDRRGTVLIRCIVGDVVSLAHDRCPHCNRLGDRVQGPIVRTKDLIKVKGMLIDPTILLDILRANENVDEYQVVVRRRDAEDPFSPDELLLRISTSAPDNSDLVAELASAVQAAVHVRPVVKIEPSAAIYDADIEAKATRLIDQRH